jgi:hypothetical protein
VESRTPLRVACHSRHERARRCVCALSLQVHKTRRLRTFRQSIKFSLAYPGKVRTGAGKRSGGWRGMADNISKIRRLGSRYRGFRSGGKEPKPVFGTDLFHPCLQLEQPIGRVGEVNEPPANSSDTFAVVQPSRPPSKQNTWGDQRQKDRDDKAPDGRTSAWSDRRYVAIRWRDPIHAR